VFRRSRFFPFPSPFPSRSRFSVRRANRDGVFCHGDKTALSLSQKTSFSRVHVPEKAAKKSPFST